MRALNTMRLARWTVRLVMLIWIALLLSVWYVRPLVAQWSRTGQEMPTALRLAAGVSGLLAQISWAVVPLLLTAMVAAVVWWVAAFCAERRGAS